MKKILIGICFCGLLMINFNSCSPIYRSGKHPQRRSQGNNRTSNPGNANSGGFSNNPKIPASFNGKIIRDVQYASNVINYSGQSEDLKMDILEPNKENAGKYPLFVFIHGGGFLVGAKGGGGGFRAALASEGFVVASIDYRLGWSREGNRVGCAGDSLELKYAIYRAVQDLNAALRFLVANADKYRIDPNWIFVGGQSAGGVMSLNSAFVSQQEAEETVPGITQKLGPLNSSGNTLTNTFKIKGVAAMWGNLHDPNLISKSDAVPVIFFHGEKDRVTPFTQEHVYFCPNFMYVYGAKPLYDRLSNLGVSAVAHVDPQGGHGVFSDEFRKRNINCFLKKVMAGKHIEGFYVGEKNSCE